MTEYGHKKRPPLNEVSKWLSAHHGAPIADIEPIRGGYWSSAWAYRCDGDDLVLRLSADDEGYRIDRAAHRFAEYGVPVPEVLHIGTALDGVGPGYAAAISRRHFGRFIEEAAPSEAEAVGVAMAGLLAAMRRVPVEPQFPAEWYGPLVGQSDAADSWHGWLLRAIRIPDRLESQWAEATAVHAELGPVFARCTTTIEELLQHCPERRDLVHGDLLHQNVLLTDSTVTGIFSWKCSVVGDFLYDVALCTVWAPWHPVMVDADVWGRTLAAPDLNPADLEAADIRHRCYQLQIAAAHLLWFVESGDDENLPKLLAVVKKLLEN